MAHVTENDYKKLASAVADDLIQNEIPLNDSITKLAGNMDLNQEQVRRLCEATNNVTFNKLFQERSKTASDRMIEFPIADPKVVLGHAVKEARVSIEKVASLYDMRPLDDEMHSIRYPEPEPPEQVKVAFELRPETKHSDEKDRRTMRKVLDKMRHEKLAADMHYFDSVNELRSRFRRIYDVPPFEQFEKAAAARFGNDAVGPLNEIRDLMGLPQVEYDLSRLTKTAGFVDDSTPEMQLISRIIHTQAQRTKLAAGITKLEGVL